MHPLPGILSLLILAAVAEPDPQSFACSGSREPGGESVRFGATIDFAREGSLTVVNPDGSPRLSYWNDVITGEIELHGNATEPMVWTLLNGRSGTATGFGVRGDGRVFSLTIEPPTGSVRPFTLFDSATGAVARGQCRF